MRVLHQIVVLKRELSRKAKLSVFQSIFVPIFTYGNEFWVMTERVRLQMQASEIRFLQKIKGVTMFEKLHSTATRESLEIESLPLLFRIKRSQLRWLGDVNKLTQERLPKQTLYAEVRGRGQLEDHEQDGLIISKILVDQFWTSFKRNAVCVGGWRSVAA